MTNREALKIAVRSRENGKFVAEAESSEFIDLCINALKKQISARPLRSYVCPCCGTELEAGEIYCVCGQKIDWDEWEE